MNKIWAEKIVSGSRTFAEVPDSRKEAVKLILTEMVNKKIINEDTFKQLIETK